jgi:hypothetical protein
MSVQTLSSSTSNTRGAQATRAAGRRLLSHWAALTAWWRLGARERQALRAHRELAGLSGHVLRDIGVCDGCALRACAFTHRGAAAMDMEIRG